MLALAPLVQKLFDRKHYYRLQRAEGITDLTRNHQQIKANAEKIVEILRDEIFADQNASPEDIAESGDLIQSMLLNSLDRIFRLDLKRSHNLAERYKLQETDCPQYVTTDKMNERKPKAFTLIASQKLIAPIMQATNNINGPEEITKILDIGASLASIAKSSPITDQIIEIMLEAIEAGGIENEALYVATRALASNGVTKDTLQKLNQTALDLILKDHPDSSFVLELLARAVKASGHKLKIDDYDEVCDQLIYRSLTGSICLDSSLKYLNLLETPSNILSSREKLFEILSTAFTQAKEEPEDASTKLLEEITKLLISVPHLQNSELAELIDILVIEDENPELGISECLAAILKSKLRQGTQEQKDFVRNYLINKLETNSNSSFALPYIFDLILECQLQDDDIGRLMTIADGIDTELNSLLRLIKTAPDRKPDDVQRVVESTDSEASYKTQLKLMLYSLFVNQRDQGKFLEQLRELDTELDQFKLDFNLAWLEPINPKTRLSLVNEAKLVYQKDISSLTRALLISDTTGVDDDSKYYHLVTQFVLDTLATEQLDDFKATLKTGIANESNELIIAKLIEIMIDSVQDFEEFDHNYGSSVNNKVDRLFFSKFSKLYAEAGREIDSEQRTKEANDLVEFLLDQVEDLYRLTETDPNYNGDALEVLEEKLSELKEARPILERIAVFDEPSSIKFKFADRVLRNMGVISLSA